MDVCMCRVRTSVFVRQNNNDGARSTPAPHFIFIIYNYLAIPKGAGTGEIDCLH